MKFKEMNTWSKVLFVVGWIGIVCSVLTAILGILFATNAASIGTDYVVANAATASGLTGAELIKATGISLAIVGVVDVIVSWFSVRAAKNNSKVMLALVFNAIDTVMNIIAMINTSSLSTYLAGVIISAVGLVACIMILNNNKKSA